MKYVPHGVTCYIIYTFYNAMLSLRCHDFTTMPCFHYDAMLSLRCHTSYYHINLFTTYTLPTYLNYNLKVA